MEISVSDIMLGKTPLEYEVKNCIASVKELLVKLPELGYYDVKIIIDGIEVEAVVYNKLIENLDRIVMKASQDIIGERFDDIMTKLNGLEEILDNYRALVEDYVDNQLGV